MSTTVDSRVVEMRFDNKHFETNVSKTMSTLEKLKQSLKFKDASKGFQDLSSAAKNVDMKTLGSSVETVKVKFSALQTVAVTALANITNSAVNAGKRIVSALTLDPVMSGFQEYETQINSIQTILSNTQHKGTTLDDVNGALDELNAYADKTIYNFTEMTRNIGTFTAAGVDLNTSVQAIKGIANLAAMSGSTSQQASTAMYQLSQALASGTVKLMDWNSVVNAGMGGEVFQNALKETARVHGVAIDKMIKDEGSFRETLSKGWLTSDILTETLAKFTGDLNESQLRTMGYTKEQIASIMELGKNANDAATKVKTFTQLIDTTKEALQSGWTQSWEIIIGDFEEARTLFTDISEMFAPIIEGSAKARNSLLEGAFGDGWDVVTNRLKEAGISVETFEEKITSLAESNGISVEEIIRNHKSLGNAFRNGVLSSDLIIEALEDLAGGSKKASGSIEDATAVLEKFNKVVKKVIRGDFGNGAERMKALADAGYEYAKVQELVNKVMAGGTIELSDLSDAQLESIGFTEDQIKALKDLAAEAKATGTPLNELMENMTKPTGRELLIDTLKNSFETLKVVIEAVGKAWSNTFGNIESGDLYSIADAVHGFSERMLENAETNAGKIQTIFEGIFAGFQITHSILSMSVVGALKILNAVLELFDMNILDLAVTIAEYVKSLRDWIDENTIFINSWSKIGTAIGNALKIVILWFESILSWDCVREFFETLGETVLNVFDKIGEVLGQGTNIFEKFSNNVKDILTLSEINPEAAKQKMREWTEKVYNGLSGFSDKIKNYFRNISVDNFFADVQAKWGEAITKIKSFLGKFSEHVKTALGVAGEGFDKFGDIVGKVVKFIGDCLEKLNINIGSLLAIGAGAALIEIVTTLAGALKALSKFKIAVDIPGLTGALKGLETKLKADALIRVAGAIAILAGSILALSLIPSERLWETIGALGALAAGLLVFTTVLGLLKKFKVTDDLEKISVFAVALSGSLLILTAALQMFEGISEESIIKGIATLTALGVGLRLFIASMSKARMAVNIMQIGVFLLSFAAGLKLLVSALDDINNIELSAESIFKLVGIMAGFALVVAAAKKIKAGSFLGIIGAAIGLKIVLGLIEELSSINSNKIMDSLPDFILVFGMLGALMALTRVCGKNAMKAAASIAIVSGAMYAMIGVVKLLSSINTSDLTDGLKAIGLLSLVIDGLIVASHFAGANATKAGVMLMGMSAAMLVLVGAIWVMSKIEEEPLNRAVRAVSILIGMMSLLTASTKYLRPARNTLTVLVVAVGLLGILLAALSMIPAKDLQNATNCIIGVMAMLTALVYVMSILAKSAGLAKGANTSIILLFVCAGGLAALLYLLKDMPVDKSIGNAVALSTLLLALSGSLVIASKAGTVSNAAFGAMLKMLGVMTLLGIVMAIINAANPTQSLENVVAISALMFTMAGCLRIVSSVTKSTKNAMKGMVSLVGIMALLGFVLSLINALNPEQTYGNVVAVSALLLVMSGCLRILSSVTKNTKNAMKGMVSLVGIVALLGFALTLINALNPEQTYGNVVAVSALLLVMSGCLKILSSVTKNTKNAMKGMVSLVGIITLLGIALTFINALNPEQTYGNVVAISALLLVMSGCLKILSSVTKNTKNAMKGMTSLVGIIALLGIALTIINALNPEQTYGNVVAISALLLVMSGCLKILSTIKSVTKSAMKGMTEMVGIMTLVGIALAIVNALNPEQSLENVLAVGLVMLGLVQCMAYLKMIGTVPKKAVKTLAMMVPIFLAIGAIMAAINALNANSGLVETLTNVAGVSALALALTGCMAVLSTIKKAPSKQVLKSLAMMSPIVLALGAVMAAINALNKNATFEQSISNTVSVAALILALSACINSLKTVTAPPKGAIKAIYQMLPIVAALGIIFSIMSVITSEASLNNATALSMLLMALSTSLFIVSKVPMVPPGAIQGLGSLTVVVAIIAAILGIMDTLDIQASIETAAALSLILATLTGVFVVLGAAGSLAGAAISGVFSFITVISLLGAFMVAVGALVTYVPEVETFLDKGIPILEKLAYGIGSFVGNLIGGLSAGALSGLPEIGNHLSNFMTNAQTFIDGAKNVDDSVMKGVGNIVGAILALTAADFINSISSFVSGGESSITAFAAKLPALGESIADYAAAIEDIDPDVVNSSANAVSALSDLANGLPKTGGWLQGFLGESMTMEQFGEHLKSFGKAMVEYSQTLTAEGAFDSKAVEASANAAMALSDLANSLPSTGGKIAEWFGDEMSLTDFGTHLEEFADSIVAYSKAITADGGIDPEAIEASANAAMALSDLANNLPNVGGKITEWFGDQLSLTDFGEQLKSFGTSLVEYSKAITADGGLDEDAITASATAASSLSKLANGLPSTGGKIKEWFLGEGMNLETFGKQIVAFAKSLEEYCVYIHGVDPEVVTKSANAAQALSTLATNLPDDKLFTNETTLDEFGSQVKEFGEYLSAYSTSVANVDAAKLSAITTEVMNLISIANMTSDLNTKGMTGFGEALTKMGTQGIDDFVNAFTNANQRVTDAAKGMLDKFISGITTKQPDVVDKFSKLATSCYEKLNVFQQHFFISGKTVMAGFISGIEYKVSAAVDAAVKAADKSVEALNIAQSRFYSAGAFCAEGFANGISANAFEAEAAAAAMAKASYESAMDELDVNSPSKVFMKGAICVPEGFAKGIKKGTRLVKKASVAMAQTALDTTEDTLDINSPSVEMEKEGEYTAWGFGKGIGDNVEYVEEATEKLTDSMTETMEETALEGVDTVLGRLQRYIASKFSDDVEINPKWIIDPSEGLNVSKNMSTYMVAMARLTDVMAHYGASQEDINKVVTNATFVVENFSDCIDKDSLLDTFFNVFFRMEELAEDMDMTPTITPVLDLSEVESGQKTLNSMFSNEQAASIGSYMSTKNKLIDNENESANTGTGETINFVQNNYSPKSLSQTEIYRQTKNLLSTLKTKQVSHSTT